MTQLVKYEAAKHALEVACTVDEAKNIVDISAAMQTYYRQVKDTEMEAKCAAIKLRAKKRLGELSKELESNQGARNELIPGAGKKSKAQVLSNIGISTSEANRCEKLAAIPEERFEELIDESIVLN